MQPDLFRQENGRIKKEKYNGDHYSSHRENERARRQLTQHDATVAGSAGAEVTLSREISERKCRAA
jgi:hypothetical protein